ncbi:MAG: HAD-IA family hydrolase [Vicinamibacteraceae bacterium]
MLSVLVFDLDGTLVDSRRDIAESANELLASLGAPPLDHDEVIRMVGEGARLLVSRVLAAGGAREDLEPAFAQFSAIYDRRLADHTRPYPGVVEGLERLAEQFTLAVLTNKPQHHTDRLLDALDLRRYFVQALGGDTVHGRKPDPAGLISLVSAAGAVPDAALLLGDSWVDAETARRGGTRFCFADYGFGEVPRDGLRPGEHRIASFAALAAVVDGAS